MRSPRRLEPWHLLAVLAVGVLVHLLLGQLTGVPTWSYAHFRDELATGRVVEVTLSQDAVYGVARGPLGAEDLRRFRVARVEDPTLVERLQTQGVRVTGVAPPDWLAHVGPWLLGGLFLLPVLLGRRGVLGVEPASAQVA